MELKFHRNDVTVPEHVMEEMRLRRGLDEDDTSEDKDILTMSGVDFLDEWLAWEGIYEYTYSILNMIQIAFGVDLESWPFDETIKREIDD